MNNLVSHTRYRPNGLDHVPNNVNNGEINDCSVEGKRKKSEEMLSAQGSGMIYNLKTERVSVFPDREGTRIFSVTLFPLPELKLLFLHHASKH